MIARDYTELVLALIARRHALGLSQEQANDRAGLADRHLSKIECGTRVLGPTSLPLTLGALGLRLRFAPAPVGERDDGSEADAPRAEEADQSARAQDQPEATARAEAHRQADERALT